MTNHARVIGSVAATGVLALALTACGDRTVPAPEPADPAHEPTATPREPTATLIPAEAQQPRTAGVCAGPLAGSVGVVRIGPDTPWLRCLRVVPEQRLKVVCTADFGQVGSPVT